MCWLAETNDTFSANISQVRTVTYLASSGKPTFYIPSLTKNNISSFIAADPWVTQLFVMPPKLEPRWDVHLPGVGYGAGSLAVAFQPLIAERCGNGV